MPLRACWISSALISKKMNTVIYIISFALLCAGIVLLFGITPETVATDIISLLSPVPSLKERVNTVRGKKKKHRFLRTLLHIKTALSAGGSVNSFGKYCAAALILAICGIATAILIKNIFLIPVFMAAGLTAPFFAANNIIENYDRQVNEELETALSVITSTYLRCGDIISAVSENLVNIKPPVKSKFSAFCTKASVISTNISGCLEDLRDSISNAVFYDWCEALIACQDDFSNSDTLVPIISRLTEIRLVNNELSTRIASCRREYWSMVLIVISNIPLLRLINKDWFDALIYTTAGKISLSICGLTIIVTAFFMIKYTRPLDYESTGTGKDEK